MKDLTTHAMCTVAEWFIIPTKKKEKKKRCFKKAFGWGKRSHLLRQLTCVMLWFCHGSFVFLNVFATFSSWENSSRDCLHRFRTALDIKRFAQKENQMSSSVNLQVCEMNRSQWIQVGFSELLSDIFFSPHEIFPSRSHLQLYLIFMARWKYCFIISSSQAV